MGKRQLLRPLSSRTNRGLRRIAVSIDSALRARLQLPPTALSEPFPVSLTICIAYLEEVAYLEAVQWDEKELKFGGHAGELASPVSSPEDIEPNDPVNI